MSEANLDLMVFYGKREKQVVSKDGECSPFQKAQEREEIEPKSLN